MADRKKAPESRTTAGDHSSLDLLSKTLESLEARLSQMNVPKAPEREATATDASSSLSGSPVSEQPASGGEAGPGVRARGARPSLSDVVSQIALRQRSLDQEADEGSGSTPSNATIAVDSTHTDEPESEGHGIDDVARQLARLRTELRHGMANPMKARFDGMRESFEDLRSMIAERASADRIGAEITRVDDSLTRMGRSGADEDMIRSLKSELSEMRNLVGQMAREETLRGVGERWDVFQTEMSGRADQENQSRKDLKDELERLSQSMGSLASEEQLKAVEARLDEFETYFSENGKPLDEAAVSELLKAEMVSLREKLETLATEKSMRAVEDRWDVLEERFASRGIETKIEAMAERMTQLESALEKLPETLSIEPLEQRVHALAVGIEALAKHQQDDAEAEHFVQLEERLDEISRAIVAAADRAPQIDMSPVERIEARLQSLTARVDDLVVDSEDTALIDKISHLSDRIETISNDPRAQDLAERIERFSTYLETLETSGFGSSADNHGIEERLQSLAEKVEEVSSSRVDEDLVRSLEAQIGNLSRLITEGGMAAAMSDPELDERFADIERRLDENRDAIVTAARAAADEAIRQMMESGDLRHNEHVVELSDDLRALEELSRESSLQSHEFLKEVQATLRQIVDRIGKIETDLSGTQSPERQFAAPFPEAVEAEDRPGLFARVFGAKKRATTSSVAASATAGFDNDVLVDPEPSLAVDVESAERSEIGDAPSLEPVDIFDSHEANRPLAVGSGAPNISALLARVRAQQTDRLTAEAEGVDRSDEDGKADFIAAARRAAMAAAAEVDNFNTSHDKHLADTGKVTDLLSRRKKPILMAVGAVLLALMALPLTHALTGEPQEPSTPDAAGASQERIATAEEPTGTGSVEGVAETMSEPAAAQAPSVTETVGAPDAPATIDALPVPGTEIIAAAEKPATNGADRLLSQTAMAPAQMPSPVADAPALNTSKTVAAAGAAANATEVSKIPPVPAKIGPEPLRDAARDGDPKALFEVGLRLMEGRGGEPDPASAVAWFESAAARGFAPAQYSLGTLYEKGNGLARDTVSARDWYVKAAEQGNVRAMHNLAVLYATGVDGKSEPKLAADWFERAAEYGMTDSQYNLGILYARGAGVDQDLARSFKWFALVAKGGDKDAADKRDEIAKSLAPAKLEAVREEVAAFEPRARDEMANTVDIPAQWTGSQSDPIKTSSVDVTKAVRNIQAILIKLGYNPGTADGIAGFKTSEAIRTFQREAGLEATGEIDETLIRALLARKDS